VCKPHLDIVASVESLQVKLLARLGCPQPQVDGIVCAKARNGVVVGNGSYLQNISCEKLPLCMLWISFLQDEPLTFLRPSAQAVRLVVMFTMRNLVTNNPTRPKAAEAGRDWMLTRPHRFAGVPSEDLAPILLMHRDMTVELDGVTHIQALNLPRIAEIQPVVRLLVLEAIHNCLRTALKK